MQKADIMLDYYVRSSGVSPRVIIVALKNWPYHIEGGRRIRTKAAQQLSRGRLLCFVSPVVVRPRGNGLCPRRQ